MRNILLAGICLLTAVAVPLEGSARAIISTQDAQAPQRTEIKVPESVLKTYVGEYEFAPERILTITLEKGSLFGQPTDQEKRQLFAESETKFFLKEIDARVTFQKDAKGKVVGLVMDQGGRPQLELKKIK